MQEKALRHFSTRYKLILFFLDYHCSISTMYLWSSRDLSPDLIFTFGLMRTRGSRVKSNRMSVRRVRAVVQLVSHRTGNRKCNILTRRSSRAGIHAVAQLGCRERREETLWCTLFAHFFPAHLSIYLVLGLHGCVCQVTSCNFLFFSE